MLEPGPEFRRAVSRAAEALVLPISAEMGMLSWRSHVPTTVSPLPGIDQAAIDEELRMLAGLLIDIDFQFNSRTTPYDHLIMKGTGDDLMHYIRLAVDAHEKSAKEKFGIDLAARQKRDQQP